MGASPDIAATRYAANEEVVARLREMADLLQQQGANPFRVNAYRHAAQTVELMDRDLGGLLEDGGRAALCALPGIGQGISGAIAELLRSGRMSQLERLRGALEPAKLFCTVPGIGPALARKIHDELHIDTLEGLEVAAHDGSLERIRGVGPRRAQAIRANLAAMLNRRRPFRPKAPRPSVAEILEIDAVYRRRAAADRLPKIAPRRFNPGARAWLPILHEQRDPWHYTALFSNTARAHDLGKTRDWVVVYCYDGDHRESQATVVTETHGPLKGRRVVRGREPECASWYRTRGDSSTA